MLGFLLFMLLYSFRLAEKLYDGRKMVKALATKSDDLTLIPRTHQMQREN